MATVEENIEATSFRYGDPYKRIDPATQYMFLLLHVFTMVQ